MAGKPGGYEVGVANILRESNGPPQKVNPQARISRRINLDDFDGYIDWGVYLTEFAEKNDGVATVRNLGHLQLVYADTSSLGAMFERKYSGLGPKDLTYEMRSVAKTFRDFVRDKRRQATKGVENESVRPKDSENSYKIWNYFDVDVEMPLVVVDGSSTRLGPTLSRDAIQIFEEEKSEIDAFLRQQGFRFRSMDRGQPHVTIVETFHSIGSVGLNNVDASMPTTIPLLEPKMFVFDNK